MKRYNLNKFDYQDHTSELVEDTNGEWVKYEDAKKEIESSYLSGSSNAFYMRYGIN